MLRHTLCAMLRRPLRQSSQRCDRLISPAPTSDLITAQYIALRVVQDSAQSTQGTTVPYMTCVVIGTATRSYSHPSRIDLVMAPRLRGCTTPHHGVITMPYIYISTALSTMAFHLNFTSAPFSSRILRYLREHTEPHTN
jgi:hypothetical protein